VSGQRVADSGQGFPKIRLILKDQSKSAERSDTLSDVRGADGSGQMQRAGRTRIEAQQLSVESELAEQLRQTFV
jgi:hypothetical protein